MYMTLFHGRDRPDQKMDGWGFDGPMIFGVIKVNYHWNNLFLTFDGDVDCGINQEKTGWRKLHHSVSKNQDQLQVDLGGLNNYVDFVKIKQRNGNYLFFSDCHIEHDNGYLDLLLGAQDDPDKIMLEGITGLYFCYGGYEIIFNNEENTIRAQQQTGWRVGRIPGKSLEIAFDLTGCVMAINNHYCQFELSVATI